MSTTPSQEAIAAERKRHLARLEVLYNVVDAVEPAIEAGRITAELTPEAVEVVLEAANYFKMREELLAHRQAARTGWTYRGMIGEDGRCRILGPDCAPIPNRLDLARHSPSGFAWGYAGSGPAQAALSLLAHFLEDEGRALRLYQDFKFACIARLPENGSWTLSGADIIGILELCEARQASGENRLG